MYLFFILILQLFQRCICTCIVKVSQNSNSDNDTRIICLPAMNLRFDVEKYCCTIFFVRHLILEYFFSSAFRLFFLLLFPFKWIYKKRNVKTRTYTHLESIWNKNQIWKEEIWILYQQREFATRKWTLHTLVSTNLYSHFYSYTLKYGLFHCKAIFCLFFFRVDRKFSCIVRKLYGFRNHKS